MILAAEYGMHFKREGESWRGVEHPKLVMLRGGGHEVDGQGFCALAKAVRFLSGEP